MERSDCAQKEMELEEFCSKYGTFTQSALWAKVKNS